MSSERILQSAVLELASASPTLETQSGVAIPGRRGADGLPGTSGDFYLEWDQNDPQAIWTIPHTGNKKPQVFVEDSGGSEVWGAVSYPDLNTVVIEFAGAFSGKAYLN